MRSVETVRQQIDRLDLDPLTIASAQAVLLGGSQGDSIELHRMNRTAAVMTWSKRLAFADRRNRTYPGMRALLGQLEQSRSEIVRVAGLERDGNSLSMWFDDNAELLGFVLAPVRTPMNPA